MNSYKAQEQKCELLSSEDTQKCLSGRSSVDLIAKSTEGNKDKTKDDCIAAALPHSAQTPLKKSSRVLNPSTKSSRALPNTCRRCGNPVNASENRTGSGLCLTCTKQHGSPDYGSSGQNKRYRNERPGSAQDRRLPDRPGSAQEKRRRPERPESARVSVSRALTFSSSRGEKEAAGRNNGKEPFAELKRPSKQRPASAQEKGRPAVSVPRLLPLSSTKQSQNATRVAAASDPSVLLPSSRQRPSSASEQRRQQGAPQMRPGHAGEGARRVLPLKGDPSEQETRSDGGDSVDEEGGGKNSNKAKLETTVLLRHRRSFNTHAAKLPLVRELSNTAACDAPRGSYIPKAENLSEEIQEDVAGVVVVDDDGNDPTVKMRPRKDVKRKESITKIPKPVG